MNRGKVKTKKTGLDINEMHLIAKEKNLKQKLKNEGNIRNVTMTKKISFLF